MTTATPNIADLMSAFNDISNALRPDLGPGTELLDIEILSRSHPTPPGCHILRDANAIAVPKASLIAAFIHARTQLLQQARDAENHRDALLDSTSVILLFDPEHLTAANTRKRLLQRTATADPLALPGAVRAELWLVDSLLTSRLHRHTKSSTLWNHRRWLLRCCLDRWAVDVDVGAGLGQVVLVAAERHPRNYYAWSHARFMLGLLREPGGVLDEIKRWVFRHHTDTSGWSFLLHLLNGHVDDETRVTVVVETAELAASLGWANESLWVFLRTAVGSGRAGAAGREAFASACATLRSRALLDDSSLQTLRRAEDWVGTCGVQSAT